MDLNDFVDAVRSTAPKPKLQRRMGTIVAINSSYSVNVKVAGSTTTITNVRYFAHYAPKVNTQVWLDTDGKDWIAIGAVAGLGGQVPTAKVYLNAAQTIATGATFTGVLWNATEFDPWGMYTSGSANVVVPITGRYLVTGQCSWLGNNTGYRTAVLQHSNGTTNFAYTQVDAGTANQFSLSVSSVRTASVGESFSLQVRQGSGANLDLISGLSYTQMTVTYLGPAA